MSIRHERWSYEEAVAESDVMEDLASFDPRVAGTPPLGLDLPDSDIDIVCFASDVRIHRGRLAHLFQCVRFHGEATDEVVEAGGRLVRGGGLAN